MEIIKNDPQDFENLKHWDYKPNFVPVNTEYGDINIHYVDEGSKNKNTVLLLHGEPTWGYLYRNFIDPLVNNGLRVVVPDLPGFGKSDKLSQREGYTYEKYVSWMDTWLNKLDLNNITIFGQDWGGLIGLRLVVNHSQRFDRVVISNTGLPYNPKVPDGLVEEVEDFRANKPTPNLLQMQRAISGMGDGSHPARKFAYWQKWCWETADLPIGMLMSMMMQRPSMPVQLAKFLLNRAGLTSPFPTDLAKAYEAPFPDPSYKMGPRAMPSQVPTLPTSPSLEQQAKAWEFFKSFDKPFLCAFADNDPVTRGGETQFLEQVPGTKGLPHTTIKGGGHFVQEGAPDQVAQVIIDLIRTT